MLGIRNYPKEYIDACRSRVDADIAAYHKLAAAARNQPGSTEALATFETIFFNNMVMLLDHFFVHRLRTVEGKDGNPLNEVRMLGDSLVSNNGKLCIDKTIKYEPAKSVLKVKIDAEINVNEADFKLLSQAFFAEMESKFTEA